MSVIQSDQWQGGKSAFVSSFSTGKLCSKESIIGEINHMKTITNLWLLASWRNSSHLHTICSLASEWMKIIFKFNWARNRDIRFRIHFLCSSFNYVCKSVKFPPNSETQLNEWNPLSRTSQRTERGCARSFELKSVCRQCRVSRGMASRAELYD